MRACLLVALLLVGSAAARPAPSTATQTEQSPAPTGLGAQATASATASVDGGAAAAATQALAVALSSGTASATAAASASTTLPSRASAEDVTLPTTTLTALPASTATAQGTPYTGSTRPASTSPTSATPSTTTTSKPSTSPGTSTTPGSTKAGGGGACPDAQAALDAHNAARARRGAPPLSWSASLAQYAQGVAGRCVLQHSGGPYGENIALGVNSCAAAVQMWLAEEGSYVPGSDYSPSTGHYTQARTGTGNVLGSFAANV
ncbi:hypothetical protein ABPG75_012668 [Micractinium tetrahymenae]